MKPGAPWSVKGIDPKAREVAKAIAHSQGKSLGDWMTEMILAAGPEGAGAGTQGTAAGAGRQDGREQQVKVPAGPAAATASGRAPPAPGGTDPRLLGAMGELARRLEQIEQRLTVGHQSLSRDVSILREGLQNLGREFVATRRQTNAQQEAILKRAEQAAAAAGAATSGVTALRDSLVTLPPGRPSERAVATTADGEDDEYEVVEFELKEGEDPRDYAGDDEYEVVTAGQPAAASPVQSPGPAATAAAPAAPDPAASGPSTAQESTAQGRQPPAATGEPAPATAPAPAPAAPIATAPTPAVSTPAEDPVHAPHSPAPAVGGQAKGGQDEPVSGSGVQQVAAAPTAGPRPLQPGSQGTAPHGAADDPASGAVAPSSQPGGPVGAAQQVPTQANPSQASPSPASPSQANPSQANPSQASPSQASPSQASPALDAQRGRRLSPVAGPAGEAPALRRPPLLAGTPDGSTPARNGLLPRLSRGEAGAPDTGGGDRSGPEADAASGAEPMPDASKDGSPLFAMTWRKGLGVPPRGAADPTSADGFPPQPERAQRPEAGGDDSEDSGSDTDDSGSGEAGAAESRADRAGATSHALTATADGDAGAQGAADDARAGEDLAAALSTKIAAAAQTPAAQTSVEEEPRWQGYRYRGTGRGRNLLIAGIGLLLAVVGVGALLYVDELSAPPQIDYVALDAERGGSAGPDADAAPPASPEAQARAPDLGAPAEPADPAPLRGAATGMPSENAAAPSGTADAAGTGPGADDPISVLRLASDQGSAQAAYELGLRLRDGIEVRPDPTGAVAQFRRSAELGYAPAQLALGVAYQTGQGIARDLDQAAYWYAVAADQGNTDAQFNFGTLYARGEGVEQDYFQAARWFQRAADAGLPDAQFNLANMLEQGLGVARDLPQAYRYFALAAAAGDPVAAERRRALAATLPSDLVAELDRALAAPVPEEPAPVPARESIVPAPPAAATVAPQSTDDGANGRAAGIAAPGTAAPQDPAALPADNGRPLTEAAEIAELQGLLNDLGFDAGPADGLMGGRTRAAITAFQDAAGLTLDGQPTQGLLAELRQLAGDAP